MRKEFIYVLKLARSRSEELSSAEEAVVEKHFGRLKKALADGKLIFAGRCEDKAFGSLCSGRNQVKMLKSS